MKSDSSITSRRQLSSVFASGSLAVVLLLAGCASTGPPLSELGPSELYQRGLSELADENWLRAVDAFERLALEYPTFERAEEARFRVGEAYAGNEEYITAANEYLRFVSEYPRSDLADDARYRVCTAYRELSPDVQLDQEYTRAAIEHCQALIAYYPNSEYVPQAREIIGAMRNKLARKVLESGEYYFGRDAYDPAIVYYEDLLERFPESSSAPKALFRLVEIYQEFGYQEELEEARERLLQEFPDSPEAQQVSGVGLANGG